MNPMPSSDLKPILSRWNSKEIELSLRNIVEKSYKQETTTDLNPKSVLASLNALLQIKRGKIMFRGAPAPSDSPSVSDSKLAVPVSDDSIDQDYENDPVCL
jgi:hypothetical protein